MQKSGYRTATVSSDAGTNLKVGRRLVVFVMVSTACQFLVCCSSTHGAPRAQPFVKVGARALPFPLGVGVTDSVSN